MIRSFIEKRADDVIVFGEIDNEVMQSELRLWSGYPLAKLSLVSATANGKKFTGVYKFFPNEPGKETLTFTLNAIDGRVWVE